MAKYEVTFSCGHTEEIQLYGKETERRRKIEYFKEKGLCRKCYQESLRKKDPVVETGILVSGLGESENAEFLVLDYAQTVELAEGKEPVRRVKTGYADGQMTYREVGPQEDFKVRVLIGPMDGSEKQIQWARDIKKTFVTQKFAPATENIDLLVLAAKELNPAANSLQDAMDMVLGSHPCWTDFLRESSAKKVIEMEQSGKLLRL